MKRMEKRAMSAEEQRDDFKEKLKEERLEKYRLGEQLEEENCDLVRIRLTWTSKQSSLGRSLPRIRCMFMSFARIRK